MIFRNKWEKKYFNMFKAWERTDKVAKNWFSELGDERRLRMRLEEKLQEYLSQKGIYEVIKAKNGLWYWRLKSSNGRILATSETYSSKHFALKGVGSSQKHAGSRKVRIIQ